MPVEDWSYCFKCKRAFPSWKALDDHQRTKHPELGSPRSPPSQETLNQRPPQKKLFSPPWQRKGYREERGKIKAHEVLRYGGTFPYYLRRIIPWFFLVGVIVFVIIFFWNPDLRSAILQRVQAGAERVGLERATSFFRYLNPTYLSEVAAGVRSFEKKPDYLAETVKGVEVKQFSFLAKEVFEGDPIRLQGEVTIDALDDDKATIVFDCSLGEGNVSRHDGIVTVGGRPAGENYIVVEPRKSQHVFVYCDLPPLNNIGGTFQLSKASLAWTYQRFTTQTVMRVYTQQRSIHEQLVEKGIDSLRNLKGTTSVDNKGYAKDNCIRGCGLADLGMDLGSVMPLHENSVNYLVVKLFGLTAWKGRLQRLHLVSLTLPEQILAVGEEGCTDLGSDLVLTEQDSRLRDINDRLAKKEDVSISFHCRLNVVHAGDGEIPTPATLLATATYDYGGITPSSTLLKVMKKVGA